MVWMKLLQPTSATVAQYQLNSIPNVDKVMWMIYLMKCPARDNEDYMGYHVMAQAACCDILSNPAPLGPPMQSMERGILSTRLPDGKNLPNGVHVSVEFRRLASAPSQDLDEMSWDEVMSWLRKASKRQFNSYGENRTDAKAAAWDSTLDALVPWCEGFEVLVTNLAPSH